MRRDDTPDLILMSSLVGLSSVADLEISSRDGARSGGQKSQAGSKAEPPVGVWEQSTQKLASIFQFDTVKIHTLQEFCDILTDFKRQPLKNV